MPDIPISFPFATITSAEDEEMYHYRRCKFAITSILLRLAQDSWHALSTTSHGAQFPRDMDNATWPFTSVSNDLSTFTYNSFVLAEIEDTHQLLNILLTNLDELCLSLPHVSLNLYQDCRQVCEASQLTLSQFGTTPLAPFAYLHQHQQLMTRCQQQLNRHAQIDEQLARVTTLCPLLQSDSDAQRLVAFNRLLWRNLRVVMTILIHQPINLDVDATHLSLYSSQFNIDLEIAGDRAFMTFKGILLTMSPYHHHVGGITGSQTAELVSEDSESDCCHLEMGEASSDVQCIDHPTYDVYSINEEEEEEEEEDYEICHAAEMLCSIPAQYELSQQCEKEGRSVEYSPMQSPTYQHQTSTVSSTKK